MRFSVSRALFAMLPVLVAKEQQQGQPPFCSAAKSNHLQQDRLVLQIWQCASCLDCASHPCVTLQLQQVSWLFGLAGGFTCCSVICSCCQLGCCISRPMAACSAYAAATLCALGAGAAARRAVLEVPPLSDRGTSCSSLYWQCVKAVLCAYEEVLHHMGTLASTLLHHSCLPHRCPTPSLGMACSILLAINMP